LSARLICFWLVFGLLDVWVFWLKGLPKHFFFTYKCKITSFSTSNGTVWMKKNMR
jgi:hypothetical protein